MKQKKRSGHILALIILLLSIYFMYAHIENYVSKLSEKEFEQVTVYEKSAKKGLFGKPIYFLEVGHSPATLHSVSAYKKFFRELEVGDVIEVYKKGDYFSAEKDMHSRMLEFYIILFLILLYPVGYFLYYGYHFQAFENWFNSLFSRFLKPLLISIIIGIGIFYTFPFIVNGVQKVLPFGKVHTEARVIDSEEKLITKIRGGKLFARYLTLAYPNNDNEVIYTKKEVTISTYLAYRDAGLQIPISYRTNNEHDIFIREITVLDIINIISHYRFFIFLFILFMYWLLLYLPLRSEWKEQGPRFLKRFQKKKDLIIRSFFWKGGVLRYTSLIVYSFSCMSAMILLVSLFTSEGTPFLRMLLLMNLNPVIWFTIGVVNMFVMRIFGSSIRNELVGYTLVKADIVIKRTAVPWGWGLLKITCKIWLLSYIPWFITGLFSWHGSLQNLTIIQVIILFLAFIPMIVYLSILYNHLNNCLKNVPILIMSKEKLRCPHSSYPWSDIKGFRSLGGGHLGVLVRKSKMEKYKVSSSTVYSLNQADLAEDISTIYQELRTYKKNSSKRSDNNH